MKSNEKSFSGAKQRSVSPHKRSRFSPRPTRNQGQANIKEQEAKVKDLAALGGDIICERREELFR